MQSANDFVQYFFLGAHLLVFRLSTKAVILVNHIPDQRAIIVGERLDVGVNIEVLSLVVFLILNVPNPVSIAVSLISPQIHLLAFASDSVGLHPKTWYLLLIASANLAGGGLTHDVKILQWAFLLEVKSYYSEEFCFYQIP